MHEIKIVFKGGAEFAALDAARRWCRENDVAMGGMQGPSPIGLCWGADKHVISKWRNMTRAEQNALDGRLLGDKRHGPLTLVIRARQDHSTHSTTSPAPERG